MNAMERAVELLHKTEMELRAMLSEVAANGDYEAVTRLNSWARQLASLPTSTVALSAEKNAGPDGAATNGLSRQGVAEPAGRKKRLKRKGKRGVPAGYPKFFRQGDDLIKVGWSKRSKKDYQHKAPHKVLLLVAEAIGKAGANGRAFTTEDILPLTDPQDGLEIPGYQTYVCLAWLRKEGVVQQKGRRDYILPNPDDVRDHVNAAWSRLNAV